MHKHVHFITIKLFVITSKQTLNAGHETVTYKYGSEIPGRNVLYIKKCNKWWTRVKDTVKGRYTIVSVRPLGEGDDERDLGSPRRVLLGNNTRRTLPKTTGKR